MKEKLECPKDLFRYFIRKNYSDIDISNEECDELGIDFYKYLESLNLTELQKENIIPKSEFDVFMNINHPLRSNGFPLGFVIHFSEYIEKMQKEAIDEFIKNKHS